RARCRGFPNRAELHAADGAVRVDGDRGGPACDPVLTRDRLVSVLHERKGEAMAFVQIRDRLLVVPAVEGHDIRSAAFRWLLLQRLQTLQFPDAWRGPGLEEIQDDVAPTHPVQREAFSAFILDDDVRGAVAAAAGNLGPQRMGSWCRRGKN